MKTGILRHLAMFVVAMTVSAPLCGCRSHVEVNGRSCAMLTDREVQELVVFARATLAKNSPRHATAEEIAEIRRLEPDVKIRYYGNCIGEAVIGWDLATRKIEIVYDGLLTSTEPAERDMVLRVMEKQTGTLDFRPGPSRPLPQKLRQEQSPRRP